MAKIPSKKLADSLSNAVGEEKLSHLRIARLIELGQMSASIAHEISNPLAIIGGLAQTMEHQMKNGAYDQAKILSQLQQIDKMVGRASRILSGLRRLARDGSHDCFETIAVGSLLEEAVEMGQMRCQKLGIELSCTPLDKSVLLECRPVQVGQILANLVNNAVDATKEAPAKWIRCAVRDVGSHILFTVEDSGPGIPDEIAGRIMESFFTTKPSGEGTGLGLSLARTFAWEHGGTLELESPRAPTRFVLRLPKRQVKGERS